MVNAGQSHMCLASETEEIMDGLTIWWRRRLARWLQRRQEGHSYVAVKVRTGGGSQGIIVVLLALVATAAYAPRATTAIAWPTAQPKPTAVSSLSLGERYDDNIFETRTDKQDDFITVLAPGTRAVSPTAPTLGTLFDFDYRAAIEFFADHSSQNNVNHRLSLTLVSPLAPSLDVRLRDLFVLTEDPLDVMSD